jgi:hypothetical protein
VGRSLDSSGIVPPFGRMLSVRLVVIGTIIVIVPFFTLLLSKALAGISAVDDIVQILVIPVSSSTVFL